MEDPCPRPECSNLWLAGSSAPAGSPAPRFARTLSNKVPSCHLPARGRLRRGSARGARREAPPPPYCTCPAEVRARNFAEPLRPVSARLSLLSPLPGERTRGGASPSLGLRSLRLGEGSGEETGFRPAPSLFAQRGEQRRGALES